MAPRFIIQSRSSFEGRATTTATVTVESTPIDVGGVEALLSRRKPHLKHRKIREFYEIEQEVMK